MSRSIGRREFDNAHELRTRLRGFALEAIKITERDVDPDIVRCEAGRLLVVLLSLGELRLLHCGVTRAEVLVLGFVMASGGDCQRQNCRDRNRHAARGSGLRATRRSRFIESPVRAVHYPPHLARLCAAVVYDPAASQARSTGSSRDWSNFPAASMFEQQYKQCQANVQRYSVSVSFGFGWTAGVGYKGTPCGLSSSQRSI